MARPSPPLPRPVWLLGWVSFATDTATEAVYPILPLFLTRVLHAGAASLGLIEGAAEAANSLLKVGSGWLSDRLASRRPLVLAGYALSSSVRPLMAAAAAWPQVLAIRVADRFGKGIRGAPRDAMLAGWAGPTMRGRVYGFHRAMDHLGAILGPLMAALFLAVYPGAYRTLFAWTIVPGAIAVALLYFVREVEPSSAAPSPDHRLATSAAHPIPESPDRQTARSSDRPATQSYRRFLFVLFLFTLGNSSDTFLLLHLGDAGVAPSWIPIVWASIHVIKAVSSYYGGMLSDRWSRRSVIAAGWTIYAGVYVGFAVADSMAALVICFLVYGLYYGLTEGTERALIVDLTPEAWRGTAFGMYHAVVGLGLFAASAGCGAIWEAAGPAAAFGIGAALSIVATLLLFVLVPAKV